MVITEIVVTFHPKHLADFTDLLENHDASISSYIVDFGSKDSVDVRVHACLGMHLKEWIEIVTSIQDDED